jgi:hypothetical protein
MTPELTDFVRAYPAHCLMGLAFVATIGIVQAAQTWRTRSEREYKLALIEHGLSVDEVERLTAGGRRRTPLEQFAALSGGAKAGIIIGAVLIANMMMAAAVAIATGHGGGLCYVNYQQVAPPPAPTPALKPAPAVGCSPPPRFGEGAGGRSLQSAAPAAVPMPPAAADGEMADEENGC